MPPPAPEFIDGVRRLAERYAGFVIDQWGVLHDGRTPFPGVLETLAELHRDGRHVVLLSNSGRRLDFSTRLLEKMGFDIGSFDAIVTSGETAWQLLSRRDRPPFDRLGNRCYLITRDDDTEVIRDSGVERVTDVAKADFLFLSGVDSPILGVGDYRPILETAVRRNLPAICSNPDLHAPSPGGLILAPGGLAVLYAEMGGEVHYIGKPHRPVYDACLEALAGLTATDIVAIGDSLAHDILGANRAGIPSVFVTGGLHAADFPVAQSRMDAVAQLDTIAGEHGASPDFVLERFAW